MHRACIHITTVLVTIEGGVGVQCTHAVTLYLCAVCMSGFHPEILGKGRGNFMSYRGMFLSLLPRVFFGWHRYCMVFSELANMYTHSSLSFSLSLSLEDPPLPLSLSFPFLPFSSFLGRGEGSWMLWRGSPPPLDETLYVVTALVHYNPYSPCRGVAIN